MTEAALVEGQVKLRDGKKWKSRWLVLRKPSPVADCLLMLVYKDKSERSKGLRERSSLTLEDICGLEPGLPYEGLAHTLAIVCLSQAVMLGFDSHEAMCAWDARIRYALGEVHRFHVTVAPGTKLESGPATLHLCNDILVLARDIPPAVMGQWKLSDLRRYGAVPSGFIFEGGTRGWCLLPVLSRGGADQLPVRLHRPRHLPHQGPLWAAARSPRPKSPGTLDCGGARGPGSPGNPAAGEAAEPPLACGPAGQWSCLGFLLCLRGRPQPVQLILGGQPLGRQRQQPAHRMARAVLVVGEHVAGGA
ncbi:PREDICTED: protein Dok-7 isoform X10 [Rhinopithecus bieti]|uniref:protein Dok-7 isoform X10 n=1 Tax=Rhinopithecus bieti TaxID=61621 RepID=UPI00083C2264|nr:PREDICTED: protein Dok-7 isoform X10 [Rhinopithecus bieti]